MRKPGLSIPARVPEAPRKKVIEARSAETNRLGAMPLAHEYGQAGATRVPGDVRSAPWAGDLYAWLVRERRPQVVVEFGAAFGVSGMYWLAALEELHHGRLYSFELNRAWAAIARRNMAAIGDRFVLTEAAFENSVAVVPEPIDIALVDGIHTADFITAQYEIIRSRAAPGAILLFDDIDFATGDMHEGWTDIWRRPEVAAAVEVNDHTGVVLLSG